MEAKMLPVTVGGEKNLPREVPTDRELKASLPLEPRLQNPGWL